jgi:sialic acid synthase SpsE
MFSLKDKEIENYLENIKEASIMMGKNYFYRRESEKNNLRFRQSIYSISEIKKGDLLTKDNIKVIRPANGLRPYFFDRLINRKSPFRIKKGSPLKIALLKKLQIKNN